MRIFNYIEQKRTATTADISHVFQMSPANVRHHLSILIDQGLIEGIRKKPGEGKGRPAWIYTPARRLAGQNLGLLASTLLNLVKEREISNRYEQIISDLAFRMEKKMEEIYMGSEGLHLPISNLTNRLNQLIQVLNHFHYVARWEAHPENPQLILGNCPYAEIIEEHPELCMMDAGLIQSKLGVPVTITQKRIPDSSGLPFCRFLIRTQHV